ncbi:hypothetical protein HBI56_102770 [Parastagonospora nodorum]|nr:hypothetical protein HBH53_091250 [Parastagonospora nodorum]KAH3956511.1 hypothetical protein HBH51_240700 [Parastagonospora nodorum]KAH3991468.1 hypothetical protein HBI10_232860 [Parastagonospora nodorum]KAH4021447.1 hypothetical protein HBI13_102830 [Parastagonospora nodorum]KAH4119896.1 hypothetical protein HBH47_120260 [Parastagonospora nodorum]
MSSLLHQLREGNSEPQRQTTELPVRARKRRHSSSVPSKDINTPKKRLQIHKKCLYERTLPGNAYISAHVNRLQHGYFSDSSILHGGALDNVFFVSVHFVFHPQDPRSHRFKSADIEVCVHGDDPTESPKDHRYRHAKSHPRILQHAPKLMFGAVSPENLQWNFSLSSSLGVSQAPVSATLNPSGGMRGSYKVFHMMSMQGSIRTKRSPLGPEHDVEDAMAVWTLEENMLQRSGLPREFDFVLLVHKPDGVKNVYLSVNVDAEIESWFGSYPQWYTNLPKYMPTQDFALDFNADIGQRFLPEQPGRGFNFASLPRSLDEYVIMPGTLYPTNDTRANQDMTGGWRHRRGRMRDDNKDVEVAPNPTPPQQSVTSSTRGIRSPRLARSESVGDERHGWAPDFNVRVVLEHQYPHHASDHHRYSYSPLINPNPLRRPSIRRQKSRTGLKDFGAKQASRDVSPDVYDKKGAKRSLDERPDGHFPKF